MPELYRLTDKADNELSTVNYQLSIGNRISDIVRSLARRIFGGEKITFDPELLTATADGYLSAVKKGYKKDLSEVDYDSPDFETLKKITENVFQFSASKDFHILTDMTNALKDGSGKLRSLDDFQAEVDKMNVKYNGNWLRTEYNQAVAASQCAARWTEQVSRAKSMPFLQYQAVMDSNTRAEHAALHGVIKRVDSDFWDKYYPPNGWGCRCEVIQLPGKNYKETPDLDIKFTKVDSMFQVNVGKKGVVFPKGHPYFMSQCQRCNGTPQSLALKPQCAACVAGRKEGEKLIQENREIREKEAKKIENDKYNQLVKEESNKIIPEGGRLFSQLPNFVNGELFVSRSDIRNICTHVPGKYKTYALTVLNNLSRLHRVEDNVDPKHVSNKGSRFKCFNYYTLELEDKTLFVTIGVDEKGKETLYAVADKIPKKENT